MKISSSFLLFLLSTILLISCSKEDIPPTSKEITGTWHGYEMITHYYINEKLQEIDTSGINFPDYLTITFNEENQFHFKENVRWQESYSGIYTIKGNKIILLDLENNHEPDEYRFILKGNDLTLSITTNEGSEQFRYKYITEIFLTKQ